MMIAWKPFRQRAYGEYETSSLCTPYRLVALMLNRIFDKDNGKFYKIGWIPLMYHVTMQGTIFKWADIVSNNLSSCIGAALIGMLKIKSEFYMGSYLIDYILCLYPFLKLNCSWNNAKTLFTQHIRSYGCISITFSISLSVRNFWFQFTSWYFLKNESVFLREHLRW